MLGTWMFVNRDLVLSGWGRMLCTGYCRGSKLDSTSASSVFFDIGKSALRMGTLKKVRCFSMSMLGVEQKISTGGAETAGRAHASKMLSPSLSNTPRETFMRW